MYHNIEKEFIRSMDTLRFSPEDKERIVGKIIQCQNQTKKSEDTIMKKWTLPKAAAVATACFLVTGGTVFAASKIVMYTAGSNGSYDYSSIAELNDAPLGVKNAQELEIPDFPEVLGGYAFDGGNTVHVAGKDDAGNTMGKWDDLSAVYKNADGARVSLLMSVKLPDEEDRTPTETRTIDGITVTYNYDEYLVLPNEDEPLDADVQKRMENDDHFYVSYGSPEKETYFYSGATFVKDGISYHLFSTDKITANELFDMAAELIGQ